MLVGGEGVGGEAEVDFLGGVGRGGGGGGGEAKDGEGEGSGGGEEEGAADEEAVAVGGAGDEAFDTAAEGGGAGHGEGGLGFAAGFGDIAEGVDVVLGIGSGGDDAGIAGVFALGEEVAAEPPDEGVEPVDEAGEAGGEGGPEVAAGEVAEFVKEDHAEGLRGPEAAGFREVEDGVEEAGDAGGALAGAEVDGDVPVEAELAPAVGEEGEEGGVFAFAGGGEPAAEGAVVAGHLEAGEEESYNPKDAKDGEGRAGEGGGLVGGGGDLHSDLGEEHEEGEGEEQEEAAEGEEVGAGRIAAGGQPADEGGEEGEEEAGEEEGHWVSVIGYPLSVIGGRDRNTEFGFGEKTLLSWLLGGWPSVLVSLPAGRRWSAGAVEWDGRSSCRAEWGLFFVEEVADGVDVLFGELLVAGVEEGGDEVFGAACEVGGEEVAEGGAFGFPGGDAGFVNIAAALLDVLDHVLALEGGEEGADGGVGGRVGKVLLDFLGGGLAQAVENFGDLPFSSRQLSLFQSVHGVTLKVCYKSCNKNVGKTAERN